MKRRLYALIAGMLLAVQASTAFAGAAGDSAAAPQTTNESAA